MDQSQLNLQTLDEEHEAERMKKEISGQHLNIRDANGMRKLIIGLSSTMVCSSVTVSASPVGNHHADAYVAFYLLQVYALHNSDGRVIWSRMLEKLAPAKLFLYR